jgi:RHS repeat-associated protein
MTTFESEPLKTATLTIGGSLSEQGMGYTITVERDAIGRITEKRESLEGQKLKQSYTYDMGGRLIEIKTGENGEQTETWGYDANGNRTHKNGVQIAVFDAQDRLLVHGDSIYEHNLMGQRTKKISSGETTAYRYDNLGNLRDVSLPNGTQIAYAIDPQDRRIGRKENGSWTHKWIYQDGLNPVAELDDQDRIRKAFVYADKGHVPSYMLTFDEDGNENGQYRIVSDLLGSVRVVYDLATGDPVQQIDYDVWGNVVNDTNPDFQPFAFAGGLYDQQTKLTRFGARDYEAETGRWTAKDPIGFDGGINLYSYAANNPINFIDIDGLAPGDTFSSPDAAAIDAGNYLFTTKPRLWDSLEYGGWIYKTDCGYSYTFSSGNPANMPLDRIPKPSGTEYAWHSHPDSKGAHDFSDWNDFPKTGGDKGWAYRNVPLYLITPTNRVKLYTPKGERTGTVRVVK